MYFPEQLLPDVVDLCHRLAKEMQMAATKKEVELGDETAPTSNRTLLSAPPPLRRPLGFVAAIRS